MVSWQKLFASLSSTVAFSYGCDIIGSFELQTEGVTWNNFFDNPYIGQDSVSMNSICLIMLFDSFIYMTLAWYIEAVFPGEYGVPRRWFFPLQPSFWFGETCFVNLIKKKNSTDDTKITYFLQKKLENWFGVVFKDEIVEREEAKKSTLEYKNSKEYKFLQDSIEIPERNLQVGIEIDNMHKVYSRANNHALKGLSVKFYKNEISAFLGHNGAGKSTTMHLLTGLYTPTAGTAKINSKYF